MWAGQSVAVLKANSQKGPLDLVFPSGRGNVERMSSILRLGWCPLQIKCGLTGETGSHRYGFPHAQACRRVAIHPLPSLDTQAATGGYGSLVGQHDV